jgi:DNA mismatch endonuclease (patch repair protein)
MYKNGIKINLGRKHSIQSNINKSRIMKKLWEKKDYRENQIMKRIGHKHSVETRRKISKSYLKMKITIETRKKLSEKAKLRTGIKNPFFGMHHTEESKQKIRLQQIGKIITEEQRKKHSISIMGKSNPFFGKKHNEESKKIMREKRAKQIIPKKDTKPERMLQVALSLEGIKFRTHEPITGQPDIFVEPNICLFVDGCYWHGCVQCFGESILTQEMPRNNLARDQKVNDDLMKQGNIVLRIWEHDMLKNTKQEANNIIYLIKRTRENDFVYEKRI